MPRLAAIAALLAALFMATAALAAPVAMPPAPAGSGPRLCLDCHHLPNLASNEGAAASQALCLECHGQDQCIRTVDGRAVPLKVELKSFGTSRHRWTACLSCHADVARSPHQSAAGAQCLTCHPGHGESALHDPHSSVQCSACHHKSAFVALDKKTGLVKLARVDAAGRAIGLTDHGPNDLREDKLCARCHTAGNKVGAPNAVLPAKGAICFLCHSASFSIGSWWFGLALLIFLVGLVTGALFYLKGSVAGQDKSLHAKIAAGSETLWSALFSRTIWETLKVLWLDVLWQRRLLKESVRRWFLHSLIYLSILAKMGLGLFTWLVYKLWPASDLALALLNKNHGFVAVTNDLLGLLMLLGVLLAALQRWVVRPDYVVAEWKDNIALIILGVMILLGFTTEAARILISQAPAPAAAWSFAAYPLSRLLARLPVDWPTAYAWLWYGHGLVAALFVAYLPFGKMRHMFTAPLSLIINRRLQ